MNAPAAFRALKGFFCVYKPVEKGMTELVHDIQHNVTQGLNRMPGRPTRQRVVYNEENLGTNLPVATAVPDLADHPLVIGERYLKDDIQVNHMDSLSFHSCGIVVMCINTEESELVRKTYSLSRQMKVYHISGQLGIGTLNCLPSGKLVEKSTYHHVNQNKMDKILAGIQSGHQKYMFELCGVDMQSQEAYELASQGLIRPAVTDHTNPVIYNIKCIHFNPPHFTLEIHCINEFCRYLQKLIHSIGLDLKTNAVCTQLRRIRYGHFTLEHTLLRNHWHVEPILKNIHDCKHLLTEERLSIDGNLKQIDREAGLRLSAGQNLIGQDNNINDVRDKSS